MGIRTNDLDGSSADFSNHSSLVADPITIMAWVNWYTGGGTPGGGNNVLAVWDASPNRGWRMSAADAPLEMRSRISTDGDNQLSTSSNTTIGLDVWNHMAIMYDGTDNEFWLNGILDATSVDAGGLFASTADLGIGGEAGGGNNSDTDSADIRIYDRILSPEEMQTIIAARGRDGIVDGLVFRALGNEGAIGALVSAVNPRDIGPNQIGFAGGIGTPVPSYVEDGGFSFRRKVA